MGTVSSYKKLKPYQLIYIRRKIIENRGFNTSIFTYYDIIRQNKLSLAYFIMLILLQLFE